MTTKAKTAAVHEAIAQLQQLSELFQQRREQLARTAGLTVQQWRVMEEITDEHFMPSMFARERDSSRAAVSKILRQLQDKGFIVAGVSPTNGRERQYELTAEGRQAMKRLREHREAAVREVWRGFAPKELRAFTEFSAELCERMQHYAEKEE